MSGLKRFSLGFNFVFIGVDLLRQHAELRKWAVVPWLIDFALFILGLAKGGPYVAKAVTGAMDLVMPASPTWQQILYYPVSVLFWVVFIGSLVYFLYLLAGIVASPFNSILADRTLSKLGAKRVEDMSIRRVSSLAARMFFISVVRGVILLTLGVLIFTVGLIPGLNFLTVAFAFLVICLDSADYSFEALEFGLRERFAFVHRHLAVFLGMASFVGLTLLIPGLILVLMPAAVCGCAAVIHRLHARAEG
jgi:CysZ protein